MTTDFHYFKKSIFIKSVKDIKVDYPDKRLNEILIVGRSNVGKSSLINALTNNSKLAYVSSKPGHTRLLNYFLINDKFYLVDAPGYGFSQNKKKDYDFYGDMLEDYFINNIYLKLVLLLLDSRRIPNEDDVLLFQFLKKNNIPFIICFTKCDKANMSERSKLKTNLEKSFNDNELNYFMVSIKNNNSIKKLKDYIVEAMEGEENAR